MADSTPSPNMSMPVPTVGTAAGPLWATLLDTCLSILDGHTHTAGSGVPITSGALNIDTDFSMGGNSLTNTASIQLSAQIAPPAAGSIYESGVDLYYVDGNGANVRLTQAGAVAGAAGTITGLPSGTASASYVAISGNFVWQSATNTAANMDMGSAIIRDTSPNSTFAVTLSAPAALGVNYDLVLPPAVLANSFLTIAPGTGAMSGSIATANGITRSNLAAVGQQVSASSGSYSSAVTGNITNLTVTITTTGRPVMLTLIPDGSANNSYIGYDTSNPNGFVAYYINRAGTPIFRTIISTGDAPTNLITSPVAGISMLDVVGAGTYTYTVSIGALGATSTGYAHFCKLAAYEL